MPRIDKIYQLINQGSPKLDHTYSVVVKNARRNLTVAYRMATAFHEAQGHYLDELIALIKTDKKFSSMADPIRAWLADKFRGFDMLCAALGRKENHHLLIKAAAEKIKLKAFLSPGGLRVFFAEQVVDKKAKAAKPQKPLDDMTVEEKADHFQKRATLAEARERLALERERAVRAELNEARREIADLKRRLHAESAA